MWRPRFRSDSFKRHHESQHTAAWEEYVHASTDEKMAYFAVNGGDAQPSSPVKPIVFTISCGIVDVIMGMLMFKADDELASNGINHVPDDLALAQVRGVAFKLFQLDPGGTFYKVVIPNALRFYYAVSNVALGLSFRQVSMSVYKSYELLRVPDLRGLNSTIVGNYVRCVVAAKL